MLDATTTSSGCNRVILFLSDGVPNEWSASDYTALRTFGGKALVSQVATFEAARIKHELQQRAGDAGVAQSVRRQQAATDARAAGSRAQRRLPRS